MVKAFVLGGGVSGLNCAQELAKKGIKVTLFEEASAFGGLAGFVHKFGRNLDLGPHIFHTPDEDIKNYLIESFPGCFHEKKHYAKNYKDGNFYNYPISREFINSLDSDVRLKIEEELAEVDHEKARVATTYFEYIDAIAGPTLRKMFFTTYPEKLWGLPTTLLDANWAPKRVQIREGDEPFFGSQWSAIGVDGTSTIINFLIKKCCELGVDLRCNTSVKEIELSKQNLISRIITDKESFSISTGDIIVNTLPLDTALSLFGNKTKNSYRGVHLVYVHTSNINPLPDGVDFIYFENKDILFSRISDQNKFVANPVQCSTVLCCEIPYSINDAVDLELEIDIESKVVADLISLNILSKSQVIDTCSVKLPRVYPMFKTGYRVSTSEAMAFLGKFPNLFTLGSLAEFAYSDLQILFAKSRDLAELIVDKTFRVNKVGPSKPFMKFNTDFKLFDKKIGGDGGTFCIAEIGLNHNGSLGLAFELIDSAINAGFDAVKFQSYKSEGRSSFSGRTSKYVETIIGVDETDFQMFSKYELSREDHLRIFDYCRKKNFPIFSAPFDLESVDLLDEMGVSVYKIASMELTNLKLLEKVANLKKPIILSTGMSSIGDIEEALYVINSAGASQVALLQCTSIYPAPAEALNLRCIDTMKKAFNLPVGYSDHFHGEYMSLVAVALGAKIIEKHITLNRKFEGPDHALSLEPHEQIEFIQKIRQVEQALGSGIKQPSREELRTELRFKKSLYYCSDLKAGESVEQKDIEFKAPCFGVLPKYFDVIKGLRLKRNIKAGEPVRWDDF